MTTCHRRAQRGMTMLEIIAVLVIMGIIAAAGALGFTTAVQSAVENRQGIEMAQKAEIAIQRIVLELENLQLNDDLVEVTASSATSLSFHVAYNVNDTADRQITLSGTDLLLDGDTLLEDVAAFSFTYHTDYNDAGASTYTNGVTRVIAVSLTVTGPNNVQKNFAVRVTPKYIGI